MKIAVIPPDQELDRELEKERAREQSKVGASYSLSIRCVVTLS